MTRGRRPAPPPGDWGRTRPAGAPEPEQKDQGEPAHAPRRDRAEAQAPAEEEAGRVAKDIDALLEDVKRERDEYLELAQRARADFENFRKRAARDVQDAERRGRAALARDLVPVVDNLERALRSAGIDPHAQDGQADAPSEELSAQQALVQGVALVYRELEAALARAGVEAYAPTGERFDPAWHEALATRPAEDAESGTVVETVERGYRLDGQVLRPARVVVSD
jgi:molecular chaperone GrpE